MNDGIFGQLVEWLSAPIFSISGSPISLRHFVSIALVVLVAWWISVLLETTVRRVATSGNGARASQSSIYAFGRIAR